MKMSEIIINTSFIITNNSRKQICYIKVRVYLGIFTNFASETMIVDDNDNINFYPSD